MDTSLIVAQITLAFIGAAVGGMVRSILGLYMSPWGCTIEVTARRLGAEQAAATGIQVVSASTTITRSTEARIVATTAAGLGGEAETAATVMPAEVTFRSHLEIEAKAGEEEEATPVEAAAPAETPNYVPPPQRRSSHPSMPSVQQPQGRQLTGPVGFAESQACPPGATIHGFPSATFVVNVVGSFILGLLTQLSLKLNWSPYVLAALGTGFCGGLTTMSSFIVDTFKLIYSGNGATAALYFCITNVACLLTGLIGWLLGSLA